MTELTTEEMIKSLGAEFGDDIKYEAIADRLQSQADEVAKWKHENIQLHYKIDRLDHDIIRLKARAKIEGDGK